MATVPLWVGMPNFGVGLGHVRKIGMKLRLDEKGFDDPLRVPVGKRAPPVS
jgi:hypothetical protein